MHYQVQFQPSIKLAADRARRIWLRRDGRGYFFYAGVPALTVLLCVSSPEITSSRAGMFLIGLLSGVGLTFGVFYLLGFFDFSKKAQAMARAWGQDFAVVEFDDEGIVHHFQGVSCRYGWKNIKRLWQQPHSWLLFTGETNFISVPNEYLSEELSRFILRNLERVGAGMIR